ncbi:MAG: ABC transporter permease [Actinobacteria bacterium]|nr:ABC transporter permease [Actinomycetota bacterium]
MNLLESFRSGLQAILANRLRSGLTMLGIMIGVAAVIVLVAFGQGASNAVTGSIEGLGTNLITVFPGAAGGSQSDASLAVKDLTVDDAVALNDQVLSPDISAAAPTKRARVTCTFGVLSHSTAMVGSWPAYFEISNSAVSEGGYFTNADEVDGRRVAVIGKTVADDLFTDTDPIGKEMICDGVPLFGDQDDTIIAPLTTVRNHLTGNGSLDTIAVQASSSQTQAQAQVQLTSVLDDRHGVDVETRDYQIFNQASLLATVNQAVGIFTALLGAVAGISLLVGGIGITNIMLVSVTERTREIGIRKAIGASRRVILLQFLIESTVLSLIGAFFGLVLAFLVTRVEVAGIQPTIVPASVLGAFAISVGIGLFFGSYPANRAASLRPIEALRHE